MSISIVVPVLNELEQLDSRSELFKNLAHRVHEIIFVDGGSNDGSYEFLLENFKCVLRADAGRARQMNRGADFASGEHVLFLHVDTVLPEGFEVQVPTVGNWGFFKLKLDDNSRLYSLIGSAINFRSRVFNVGTGDQCLVINKRNLGKSPVFRDIKLMEDIEFSRRMKKTERPTILDSKVITSARRWKKNGPIKTIFLMWCFQLLYLIGVSPDTLHSWYYQR